MAETKPETAQSAPRLAGRWRWLLIASLAVNLLVLGIVGGAVVSHGRRPPPDPREFSFGPFTEALSAEDRAALRAAFMAAAPEMREAREQARAGFGALVEALRAEPYDAGRVADLIGAQRDQLTRRMELGERLVLERIATMGGEERAAFADRLEEGMRRGPRGHDHDGRRDGPPAPRP